MDNNQLVAPMGRKAGFGGALLKGALAGLWLGAILFIAAGRLDWPVAWVYTGISMVAAILLLLVVSPELMRERTHPKADAKAWDRVFARLTGPLGSIVILVVAGLDKRFGWSAQTPPAVQFVGLAAFVCGMGLMTWAMAVNPKPGCTCAVRCLRRLFKFERREIAQTRGIRLGCWLVEEL